MFRIYLAVLRYSNAISACFFLYHALYSLALYKGYRNRNVVRHVWMCLTVAAYSGYLVLASGVKGVWINEIPWVLGGFSYYCYLRIIFSFFFTNSKLAIVVPRLLLAIVAISLVSLVVRLLPFVGVGLLFAAAEDIPPIFIARSLNVTTLPTAFGQLVGLAAFLATIVTSGLILRKLWAVRVKDVFLICGVVATLISTINDVLLSLNLLTGSITLYFVGYVIEAARFVYLFQEDSFTRTKEIAEARDRAQAANQAKSDFLSRMSHELRTPMNAIIGFSHLLDQDDSLTNLNRSNVREIRNAGDHLLELINEVLDLAKVESGGIDISLEPVRVRGLVDECLGLVVSLAKRRAIDMRSSCADDAYVKADRTRLKQSLLNLLSNAIKYNRRGGRVQVNVEADDERTVRIEISDTGEGIARDKLEQVFEPFTRVVPRESGINGTGVGLTLTRSIVELMGGTIGVKSVVPVGSTFWIDLPVESPPVEREEPETGTDEVASLAAVGNRDPQQVVLYIEDDPTNVKLVARLLGPRKHVNLVTAHTPSLGIELAMASEPDLILMDINLPGTGGYRLLEMVQAEESLRGTPVVAVTANAMPADVKRGKSAGFAEYLTKPLNIPMFNATLDRFLGDIGPDGRG